MSVKIEEGKVYLRDVRTGQVHPYESILSQMSYMHKFVGGKPGEELPNEFSQGPIMPELTPQERAAEFDRIAAMPKAERETYVAEKQKKEEFVAASAAIPEPVVRKITDKRYRFTAKHTGIPLKDYTDAGWTIPTLVQHGYLEEVTDENTPADVDYSPQE